jgi:hypothetical protein
LPLVHCQQSDTHCPVRLTPIVGIELAAPIKPRECQAMRMPPTSKKPIPDDLVLDTIVQAEFEVSHTTLYNWTHDPDSGFPPQIMIGRRAFRSRKLLEAFKARRLREAVAEANRIFGPRVSRRAKAEA